MLETANYRELLIINNVKPIGYEKEEAKDECFHCKKSVITDKLIDTIAVLCGHIQIIEREMKAIKKITDGHIHHVSH